MLESFARSGSAAIRGLRVRSALNPLLWLTGLVTPLCILGAIYSSGDPELRWALLAFAAVPVIFVCVAFVVFAVKDPKRLQSEDYQLRHESLLLLQSKSGPIPVSPASLTAIANPSLPALPPAGGPEA